MIIRIKDWIRPISQTIILLLIIILAYFFDFSACLASIIKTVGFADKELPFWLRTAAAYGRWPLSIVVVVIVWICIWKANSKDRVVLNPDNNIYHDHFYFSYCFCSKLFGYRQCRLKGVPIPMQIKLVANGVFDKYIVNEGVHKAPKNDKVKVGVPEDYTSTVNLLVSDTYKAVTAQLPGKVLQFSTVEIDRSSNDHTRYDSEELVKNVISTLRNFPKNVTELNVFMTTNPTNTYRITKEAFATSGRDRIKHLYAFPQDKEEPRNFSEKRMKIF